MPQGETPSQDRKHSTTRHHDLSSLIETLRNLFFQVSQRLWGHRLQPREPSVMAGDSADIRGSLEGHLNQAAARANEAAESETASESKSSASPSGKTATPAGRKSLFSGLAQRLKRGGGRTSMQPHMAEKMQANTTEHINKALRLARQGNAAGAKMHTGLAESAMKTASEYMGEEEYRAFKEEVERKISAILKA